MMCWKLFTQVPLALARFVIPVDLFEVNPLRAYDRMSSGTNGLYRTSENVILVWKNSPMALAELFKRTQNLLLKLSISQPQLCWLLVKWYRMMHVLCEKCDAGKVVLPLKRNSRSATMWVMELCSTTDLVISPNSRRFNQRSYVIYRNLKDLIIQGVWWTIWTRKLPISGT